mmetsp:Transcript_2861/g.5170  ORF Transcript_2861/g.5170 Transcript_2861/m.5170 type:complete len:343 (+) Transcript_2861:210-1238(+)
MPVQPSETRKNISSLIAGGMAGMTAKTVVAPLERVKIMFQVTNDHFSLWKFPTVMMDIFRKEGLAALWRGHSAALLRIFPYAGIQFMTYDYLKRQFSENFDAQENTTLVVSEAMICGGTAGAVSTAATYPLDLARSRLAITPLHQTSNVSRFHVVKSLHAWHKVGGVAELYKGLSPTLLGVVPYGAIAFSTNEAVKRALIKYEILNQNVGRGGKRGGKVNIWQKLLAGALAGIVAQTSTYPLEILRRRMQTAGHVHAASTIESTYTTVTKSHPSSCLNTTSASPSAHSPMNMSATFVHLYSSHGWRVFFKGVSLNWIKGPVTVSISFTTFDFFKNMVEKWKL